ncbi:MAG: hypothetical protein WD768_08970 [Phycisphaeraceae bacterium]
MQAAGIITMLIALAGCATTPKSDAFSATAERRGMIVTLHFHQPPEFTLTLVGPDEGDVIQYIGTEAPDKVRDKPGVQVFKFVKTEKIDQEGNKTLLYKYRTVKEHSAADIFIWTGIEKVSAANLEHMKIDRAPFCIVQFVNEAGVFAVPLERNDSPVKEPVCSQTSPPKRARQGLRSRI